MKRVCLLVLLLCVAVQLYAQQPIRFGDREVYLETNVRTTVRGHRTSSLELGVPTGEKLNVLVQFEAGRIPYSVLKQKGVELGDYLGANAYYAKVTPGSRPSDFVGTGLRAVVPIRGEWKVVSGLLQQDIPEWAYEGNNLKMNLSWFDGITWEQVKRLLDAQGATYRTPSEFSRSVEIVAKREAILALAEHEAISFIRYTTPPMEVENFEGAHVSGAFTLRTPTALGGRGLTGRGVRIGIWDGNVADHVDYGRRVHRKEFELSVLSSSAHGMHTTGTILGSGLRNEKHRGMAPEAEIWTYNFNMQSNGLTTEQEMYLAALEEKISLTSNSYGMNMKNICGTKRILNYSYLGQPNLDLLAYVVPTLTHVFSAGNSQGACGWKYSHVSNYGKNIISVAAVKPNEQITTFSSFGPLLDGRMFPIISALGQGVWSTVDMQSYWQMDGTSMSCPTVTGHLALLTQRYKELHGGAIPYNYFLKALIANTARDAGNPGPDYKYGFGLLDGVAAITAMENNWYKMAVLPKGGAPQTTKITVPAGVKELRVMLCWNDPVADKEYATGENPMINDLDLSVTANGTTHLPLTLDAKTPDALAVEKENKLDNIEQVVWKMPAAGEYTIQVSGAVNQEDEQPYAIVWYYDKKQPAITAPLEGEIYTPDEKLWLRTENLQAPLKVELSVDGGASYTPINGTYDACALLEPLGQFGVSKAVLRVTDRDGNVLQSGTFSIMSQVKAVKLTAPACGTDGWKLTWKKAYDAAKYEILKADFDSETVEVIGETPSTKRSFEIPSEKVNKGRNLFSVRAVSAEGVRGIRSIGEVQEAAYLPALTADNLPYFETFVGWPLKTGHVETGKNLDFRPVESLPELRLPFDSHILAWDGKIEPDNWDDPFAERKNVGQLSICELDLTGLEDGTEIQLFAHTLLLKADGDPTGSQLRLLVNGEEYPDVMGRKRIIGDGEERRLCWDLSKFVKQKVSLKFEGAMKTSDDGVAIVSYRIIKKTVLSDVGVAWVNDPEIKAEANLQERTIRFDVQNYSSKDLKNVPISVEVDGKLIYSESLESLKPFEDRIITCKHNFYSKEAHKFRVDIHVDCDDDANPYNNDAAFEVYNLGDIIAMPEIQYINVMGMIFPRVPFEKVTLSGNKLFTDGRGELEPYYQRERAVLQIQPEHDNGVVQIVFRELALAKYDTLYVFTGNVPDNLNVDLAHPSLVLAGQSSEPRTIISEARNGAITFAFKAENPKPGDGWIADASEILMENTLAITEFREVAGKDATHSKLEVIVQNFTPAPIYEAPLFVTINDELQRFEIPVLKANSTTSFILPDELDVTPPVRVLLVAELAKDGKMDDNRKELLIERDPLWNGGGKIKTPATLYMSKVYAVGAKDTIAVKPSAQILYLSAQKLELYTESNNALGIHLSALPAEAQLPASLRVWIDVNKDGVLDDTKEAYTVALQKDVASYLVPINSSSLVGVAAGEYRMRIMLAKDEDYLKFKGGKEIEWGSVVDVTAELKEGRSPSDYELALVRFADLKSGRTLSTETSIKLKVRNNGLAPITKIALTCTVDEKTTFDEEVSCNIAVRAEEIVELSRKVDFSAEGKHTLHVALKEPDSNTADNEAKITVYKIPAKTSDLYSLKFVAAEGDGVLLQNVATEIENDGTIEGWWRLDEPQSCAFADGGKAGIWMASLVNNPNFRDNTLVFMAGINGLFASLDPCIVPGKWQHIAATFYQTMATGSPETWVKVYVDGKHIPMRSMGFDGFKLRHLGLNVDMKGENAMFRIWKKQLEEAEVVANMTKSVRQSDGKLPADCLGEFVFTEGHGVTSASGDERFALIVSKRDNIWQKIENLVSDVTVEGQLIPAETVAKNEVKVTMASDFNAFSNVKVKFGFFWPGAVVTQNGNVVTDDTELDFSSAEHKLSFKVKYDALFGMPIEQDVTIQLVNDKSGACDLLEIAMPKAKNPGLKNELSENNPKQLLVWEVESESATNPFNPKKAKIVVKKISDNAKLYRGDEELVMGTEGVEIEADMNTALKLRVVAQNGRNVKFYTIRLSMAQEITWGSDKLVYPFSGTPTKLDATASSELPVSYYSLDPSVATVDAQGNLVTGAVGTTTIVAEQKGNELYKVAEKKQREVEVTRVPLTIKMKDATMAQGEPLPYFDFEYEGLQFDDTEEQFDAPYEVRLKDGTVWNETLPALAPGEYVVAPANYTAPYPLGSYTVTRENGKLTVTAPQLPATTFVVTDENNAPCPDAVLQCDGVTYPLGADGKVVAYLKPGKYQVEVSKAGYESDWKDFVVADAPQTVELQLLKEIFTLTYTTDEFGVILGKEAQTVALHSNGEQVIAVPKDSQHRFKEWSDGVKTAARTEMDVQASRSVKATFEAFFYTLSYKVSDGGEFETTNTEQQVAYGGNATPVKVKAKEGYIFMGWTDGNSELTRTDVNVKGDLSVTAVFLKPYRLAWKNDFERGASIEQGWNYDKPAAGRGWGILAAKMISSVKNPSGHVLAIAPLYESPRPEYTDCWVASPWFSLEEKTASTTKLILSYVCHVKTSAGHTSKLQYSFEDEVWHDGANVEGKAVTKQEKFELDLATLAAHKRIRFRWVFGGSNTYTYLALDDIEVKFDVAAQEVQRYFAGAHGHIKQEGNETLLSAIEQTTEVGNLGTKIVAVPDAGYVFDKWSDGKTEDERQDNTSVSVEALFKKGTFKTIYLAGENGKIEGITMQVVAAGGETAAVTAVPNVGYKFDAWDDGSKDNPRKDLVTEDKTYTANFVAVPSTYVVTLAPTEHGRISIQNYTAEQLQAVPAGTTLTVVVTPDAGWKLKTLTANGDDIAATKQFTVNAAVTVLAVFEKEGGAPQPKTFAVTLTKEGEGTLTITDIEEDKLNAVPEGTELMAVATPAKGWRLKSLTAGTQGILADGKFTVTADVEVKAVFEKTTAVEDAIFANVLVAPNPFIAQLRLVCNGATGRYDLLNAQGVVVRSGNMDGNEVMIETTDLTSGLYLLRLTAENGATKTITVVKER